MEKVKELYRNHLVPILERHPNALMIWGIILIALVLRVWDISNIPGGFSANEKGVLDAILRVDLKHLWLGSRFHQGIYIYGGALWLSIFGETVSNLRLFSALIGTSTVAFMYLFVSKWFSQKIAIFSCFLLAISSFHINISRLILPEVVLPLILFMLFVTLTEAYRNKNPWLFGLAGALTGLGFYANPVFLLVPVLFALSAVYFVYKNKKFITAYKNEILVYGAGFLSTTLPFWVAFNRNPKSYLTFFGFNRSIWQILINIGQIPTLLFNQTALNYFTNLGNEPLMDPFIYITFIAGFVFALFSIQRRKYFFLLTWLVLFSLYAALKRGVSIPDLVGILPIVYVFSGLMLDYVLGKWFQTFPVNKSARLLVVALISIFFALSALYNFDKYFIAYANSRSVTVEFSEPAPIPLK